MTPKPDKELSPEVVEAVARAIFKADRHIIEPDNFDHAPSI